MCVSKYLWDGSNSLFKSIVDVLKITTKKSSVQFFSIFKEFKTAIVLSGLNESSTPTCHKNEQTTTGSKNGLSAYPIIEAGQEITGEYCLWTTTVLFFTSI